MLDKFLGKIKNREAVIGLVGLGYVGLPLLIEFSKAGFSVIGFDTDKNKIRLLKKSESYIQHIGKDKIKALNSTGKFNACSSFEKSAECDAILICVPTPLTKQREPDMTYIISTGKSLAPFVRKGQLFSLESTTYPGTTDEVLKPILEKGRLKAGEDLILHR